jgi:hypothetical protein
MMDKPSSRYTFGATVLAACALSGILLLQSK